MRFLASVVTALFILQGACLGSYAQAPADAFNAAYASAQAVNKKAGELKNQWTTTSATLAAAKKAADSGDYETAIGLAKQAEALAAASIAQVQRESTLWKESELR